MCVCVLKRGLKGGGFGAEVAAKRGDDVQSGNRSELGFLHEQIW